jgi:hypothetical protein
LDAADRDIRLAAWSILSSGLNFGADASRLWKIWRIKSADVKRLELDEKKFRYLVNGDAMATEKTAEGIRKFASDIGKLEKFVARKIN